MLLQRTWLLLLVSIVAADDALIKWIGSNGGVFSEKVHFEHLDPNDDASPYGLFANEALEKGETIMVIPHKCLLTTPPPQSLCQTARFLAENVRQRETSFFKDYVNYLFNGKKHRKLPYRWSKEGKKIMNEITGGELYSPIREESFERACGGGDQIEEDAFESVISRSWEEVMIPLYDMVNHRNGHWRNVEATSAHVGKDVTAYAYRDIKAGEQLFMSYNECDDIDCEGLFYSYGTQEILGDYGFVEEFPQRWIWTDMPGMYDDDEPLMIEIDQVEKPDPYDPAVTRMQYELTWHTDVRPNLDVLNFMTSQVERLERLESGILTAAEALESGHEQYTIREYCKSLKLALKLAIWSFYDEAVDELPVHDRENVGHQYDALVQRTPIGDLDGSFPSTCHPDHEGVGDGYRSFFNTNSHYQSIEYRYSAKSDDTCLWLSDWLQTCSSFRQYHEALVHYPASFLPEVKRVAYMGGGDNMILHEILKYPSIELVVGLELDQQVVRSAFMNLGTLPYFDDPRVQWWFGDATKSLLMLPAEYFGSFDLVLIDLQTFVADALFVTDTLSIMDTAKLLVKESTGIISKNEDFPNRQLTSFARYTVAMEYCDLPQICRQSISIGSNSINFLNAPQFDHDIPRIYMNETLRSSGRFNHWYDFRDNFVKSNDSSKQELTIQNPSIRKSSPSSNGLLVVIEAEELDGSIKDKEGYIAALKQALAAEGIEVLSVDNREGSFDFALVFREGYIVARKFSAVDNYMSLDLVLWGAIEKSNLLKSRILSTVGGNENKASSFRLVMGGIEGTNQDSFLRNYSPTEESCANPNTNSQFVVTAGDPSVWVELSKLIPYASDSSVAVLCGSIDDPCATFQSLKAEMPDLVFPIYTCSDWDPTDETTFFKCEAELMKALTSRGVKTLSGIVLDIGATESMTRVFLRLITGFSARSSGILSDTNYVVLAELNNDPWRAIFVERFRSEIAPFSPAKEARLRFGSDREYSIFASNDLNFYANLASFEARLNSESSHTVSVKTVMSGHAAYVPDFNPPFFNNANFDNARAYRQWNSQKPIGMQVLFQLELIAPKKPLEQSEPVLWQRDNEVWVGEWVPAIIFGQNSDTTYDITSQSHGFKTHIPRDRLRKLDFDGSAIPPPLIHDGARVLIRLGEERWGQGFVVSRSEDGVTYKVRLYSGHGEVFNKPIKHLIPQMETTDEADLPVLSMASLSAAFNESLALLMTEETFGNMTKYEHSVLNGGILTAFWDGGNAVLIWNGEKHVDINLFLSREDGDDVSDFHEYFVGQFPFMATLGHDEQPRGYGGVVNFAYDMDIEEDTPIWWHGDADSEEGSSLPEVE